MKKAILLLFVGVLLFIQCQKDDSNLNVDSQTTSTIRSSIVRNLNKEDSLFVVELFNSFKKECSSAQEAHEEVDKAEREMKKLSNEQYRLFMHMVIDSNKSLIKTKRSLEEQNEFEGKAKEVFDNHIDSSIKLFGNAPHLLTDKEKKRLAEYEKKNKRNTIPFTSQWMPF